MAKSLSKPMPLITCKARKCNLVQTDRGQKNCIHCSEPLIREPQPTVASQVIVPPVQESNGPIMQRL